MLKSIKKNGEKAGKKEDKSVATNKKPRHMAQNIYSNPVLRGTSGKFEGFSIDFRGVKTPLSTYWALCNWGMDLTSFKQEHPDAHGGGAYAGLQNTVIGRLAIMSFWETFYDGDKKRHNAKRVYPAGESTFGGEGEGTNNIVPFPWETGKWYRMILRSWTDAERGTTFVGQWVIDREKNEWTLVSYFDTGFKDSCFVGRMSQFQENFWDRHYRYTRSFHYKNIFVKDQSDGKWKYAARTSLSYDDPDWGYHTGGKHEFGATSEYFFGASGGDVPDQAAYDAVRPLSAVYEVKQKEELVGGRSVKPKIEKKDGGLVLGYSAGKGAVPALACAVRVLDAHGKTVFETVKTRPEDCSVELPEGKTCVVTLTDVFGRETKTELKI